MQIVISYSSSPDVFLCLVSNSCYSEIAITIDLFQLIFRSVIFLKSLGKLQVSQTEDDLLFPNVLFVNVVFLPF